MRKVNFIYCEDVKVTKDENKFKYSIEDPFLKIEVEEFPISKSFSILLQTLNLDLREKDRLVFKVKNNKNKTIFFSEHEIEEKMNGFLNLHARFQEELFKNKDRLIVELLINDEKIAEDYLLID